MSVPPRARTLAITLERRMGELSLDQRSLAERAGVAPATIRQLLRATSAPPKATTLAKLSRALEWPPDALVKVLSALPADRIRGTDPAGPAPSEDRYEPPSLDATSLLQRLTELEDALATLRRDVTSAVVGSGPGQRRPTAP